MVVKAVKTDFTQELLRLGKRELSIELGPIPNTAWASGDLEPRSRVGVTGWKITTSRIILC